MKGVSSGIPQRSVLEPLTYSDYLKSGVRHNKLFVRRWNCACTLPTQELSHQTFPKDANGLNSNPAVNSLSVEWRLWKWERASILTLSLLSFQPVTAMAMPMTVTMTQRLTVTRPAKIVTASLKEEVYALTAR